MKKEKRARARRTGAQAAESGAARPAGGAGKMLRALGFAQKLTLAMLLVLAMALSLGGAVVLAGNFDDALNEAGQQAEVQHLLQCYALESDLLDVAARGETVTDSHLARYGSSLEDYVGGKLVALYRGDAAAQGGTSSAAAETETEAEAQAASNAERQPAALRTVYTSFPWDEGPTGQTDTYRMHRDGGRTYMLFEAEVETVGNPPVTLLTGHDVTSVFAARDRALLRFWEMELVVLVCAGAMIALLSRWLTKPLARLTQASESIAGGAYGERTGLSGGDEIGVLSRSFDAMAAAVQEKVDALELSVRQREDFMSAFTHELKTPMTSIAGYTDGILDGTIPPEQEKEYLRIISDEARRLSRLVRRMLEVSQLQSRDLTRTKAPFDVCESMRRVLISMEKKITDRGLDVDADIPDSGIMVLGDNDLITQVIYNLLENAAKFARKGSALYLGVTTLNGKALISVRNEGDTIPAEEIPLLFERFHKSDKSRSEEKDGVGLGLYVVKTILDQHKEHIAVTSENGLTTFTFTVTLAGGQIAPQ